MFPHSTALIRTLSRTVHVRILDMAPCRRDPCKVYDPQVAFRGALEVNRGAFERRGVRPGAFVTIRR